MFLENKLCIPLPLQRQWIRDFHQRSGHVGFDRLWSNVIVKKKEKRKSNWGTIMLGRMRVQHSILRNGYHMSVTLVKRACALTIGLAP